MVLGLRVEGLGFRVEGLGSRVRVEGFLFLSRRFFEVVTWHVRMCGKGFLK